jgi:hypothetical protein
MKTLHLPLKAKWYEMIESGVKTEEYREIKPYWTERLTYVFAIDFEGEYLHSVVKHFDYVKFSYGNTKRTMTFEIESITIGKGKPEWGAPAEDVFIIKLGKRV